MKTKIMLVFISVFLYSPIYAYDFVVDNIAYNITSPTTVETTWNYDFLLAGDITIPSQVTNSSVSYDVTAIGPNTFNGCGSGLKSVSIPTSVVSIGHYAFYGCDALTSILIPSGVTYIGERGFIGCSGLTSITIPKSLSTIESETFLGCSGLISLNFESPSSLSEIKFAAFEYCGNITDLSLPNTLTKIGARAFQFSGIVTINIPSSVFYVGYYAFDDTPWLNNQPNGLIYVEKVAYTYKGTMPENSTLTLQPGTIGIAENAFYGQGNLKTITLPSTLEAIGGGAFTDCTGLQAIYCHVVTPINLANSIFSNVNTNTCILYVPTGTQTGYSSSVNGKTSL